MRCSLQIPSFCHLSEPASSTYLGSTCVWYARLPKSPSLRFTLMTYRCRQGQAHLDDLMDIGLVTTTVMLDREPESYVHLLAYSMSRWNVRSGILFAHCNAVRSSAASAPLPSRPFPSACNDCWGRKSKVESLGWAIRWSFKRSLVRVWTRLLVMTVVGTTVYTVQRHVL